MCCVLGRDTWVAASLPPTVLTLERFEGVHEVQVGLQRDQPWLNHVCVPQMRWKKQKGTEEPLCFLRQSCRDTREAWHGPSWTCSHSRFFQGEMWAAGWDFYLPTDSWPFSTLRKQGRM